MALDSDPPESPPGTDAAVDDGVSPLEALLELSRSAGEDELEDFLATVADTVARTARFTTVAINLFRPAWDDYEVALVVAPEDATEALIGTSTPRSAFRRIFAEADQRLPGVFFLAEESAFWADLEKSFTPVRPQPEGADAWRPGDGLLVFLSDSTGAPLGFVSMDEPLSGMRPSDDELRLVRALCSHAEQALESARRAEAAAEHRRILSLLACTAGALADCTSAGELLELAGRTVVPHLGFERFAGYAREGRQLRLHATEGWEDTSLLPATLPVADIDALLATAREQAGCFIGAAAGLFGAAAVAPGGERSRRNGQGATAWHDHCLAVPCHDVDGELLGLIAIEDPSDRQLPSEERRRALRLLVDQVAAALTNVQRPGGSDSDRRQPAAGGEAALLVCEVRPAADAGAGAAWAQISERALASLGELVRELARVTDIPVRVTGEEASMWVVLPGTDRAGAERAAQRLAAAATERLAALCPGGIEVSAAVADASSHALHVHSKRTTSRR